MGEFTIKSVGATSITISVTGLTVGYEVRYFIRLADDEDNTTVDKVDKIEKSSVEKTLTGLSPNTDYKINVLERNPEDYSTAYWFGAQDFTTEAQSANDRTALYFDSTSTSATLGVGHSKKGDQIRFLIYLSSNKKTPVVISDWKTATTSATLMEVSGLTPKKTYYFEAEVIDTDGNRYIIPGDEEFTTGVASRPDDWEWYSTIEAGAIVNITASEWNDFTSRINEFRTYKDELEYDFTRAHSGDNITADMANELRVAISSVSGHGTVPKAVSKGDIVRASFFIDLKNALNAIS